MCLSHTACSGCPDGVLWIAGERGEGSLSKQVVGFADEGVGCEGLIQ